MTACPLAWALLFRPLLLLPLAWPLDQLSQSLARLAGSWYTPYNLGGGCFPVLSASFAVCGAVLWRSLPTRRLGQGILPKLLLRLPAPGVHPDVLQQDEGGGVKFLE